MRGRIVLFTVLAVAAALAAATRSVSHGPRPPTTATATPSSPALPGPGRTPGGPTARPLAPRSRCPRSPRRLHAEGRCEPGGTATQPPTAAARGTSPEGLGVAVMLSGDMASLDSRPEDYRALTANFSDPHRSVGRRTERDRCLPRHCPHRRRQRRDAQGVRQGFAHAEEGAYAQLTLKLNGQARSGTTPAAGGRSMRCWRRA
jgi:hypothetical protein